jgi:hypothetical protein
MNLPYELLWGVDVAIRKLRPNARFEIQGSNITFWESQDGLAPPEWHEIHDLMEEDRKAAEDWISKNSPVQSTITSIEDRPVAESAYSAEKDIPAAADKK